MAPLFINQKIDEYIKTFQPVMNIIINGLPGQYKKGDLKVNALENEKLKMERLRSAVNEFENFRN